MTLAGYTRRARAKRCGCGAGVVFGLDGDLCAFETDADPVPLSELGVVAARLAGRRVVGLTTGIGRPELFRSSSTVPPGGSVFVLVHECGFRVPVAWRASESPSWGVPVGVSSDEPPF